MPTTQETIAARRGRDISLFSDMLEQDSPRDPENLSTLEEHETAKETFLGAKSRLEEEYHKITTPSGYMFYSVSWDELSTWAFDSEKLHESACLYLADRNTARELSDLAFEVLSTQRSLAQTFGNLTKADKQSLRPQNLRISWPYRDRFEGVELNLSELIEGDAADRYLCGMLKLTSAQCNIKDVFSDQIQEILTIRSEGLTKAQELIAKACFSSEGTKLERLHGVELTIRAASGAARDNGDIALWQVISRCLDPYLLSGEPRTYGRGDRTTPQLYISETYLGG